MSPRNWTTLAALLALQFHLAQAGVVAVGKLQSCVNDGTTPSTSLSCSQKIVVTVELENNKLYETERLNFAVSCVNSPTDQCPCPCNYATDPNCACRDLRQEVSVAATKSPVFASYPITFFKFFNGRPYEDVIVGNSCSDAWLDAGATCGFAQLNGQDIADSQGFCCDCDGWFNWGGASGKLSRGNLHCGWVNTEHSAHCLRLDPTWWHMAFLIGEYALDFTINLNITTTTTTTTLNVTNPGQSAAVTTATSEVVQISPSAPFKRDTAHRLSAKLLGDLESYQQAPQLDGKYLLIPRKLGQGPQDAYSNNRQEWMVVDDNMVTTTGLECNKIGVDYSGFRNSQPNACTTPQGSCLHNQIVDLYAGDIARMNAGQEPLYFVGRYGGGTNNTQQLSGTLLPGGTQQLLLNLPISAIKTSLLTLTVAADDVAFVVNRSPAQITSVQVCTYDGRICGGFQAMTAHGYLTVTVRNSGYVASDYTVQVTDCSIGVRNVLAQRAGIAAQSSHAFQFELQMESDAAANNTCTVSVVDSLGDTAASQGFSFYTNATDYGTKPDDVDQSDIDGNVTGPNAGSSDWCQRVCPNVMNFKCAIDKGCYTNLAKGISTIAGPLVGLGALFFAWKSGHLGILLRLLSFLFCSSRTAAATAAAAAPVQQPVASNGDSGWRKDKSKGATQRESEEGPGDGVVRVHKEQQQQAPKGWKALQVKVAGDPPDLGERLQRRSSSLSQARASIVAAAQQAREMLLGLQSMVSNPLAMAGDEEQAHRPLSVRVAPPSPASPAWASLPPASPFSLGGRTPTATPMAGAALEGGGSPLATSFFRVPGAAGGSGPPGSLLLPLGTPTASAPDAAGMARAGAFGDPAQPPSLEQQLRQVQQQRQLLRQLQAVQQQQQQMNQSFTESSRRAGGGEGTDFQALERAASAPALFLAQLGSQLSLPVQQQQQQLSSQLLGSLPGTPNAAAAPVAGLLGRGLPVLPPRTSLMSQASLPVLQQQADLAHMVARLAPMGSLPAPAEMQGAPVTAGAPDALQLQAPAWQQQQQGMRALGLPSLEAQQQKLRRLVVGTARSRFAPGGGPAG